jgi:hypothetical protein
MTSFRPTRRRLLGAALAWLVPRAARAAPAYQPLFRIERSKNANIVQFDAVLESAEKLAPREPVICYWVLRAEDGRRATLSSLDRRAYGFKVVAEPGGAWLLYLNASKDRSIRVVRWQGRWVAQMLIRGRSAVLTRMFVSSDESALVPRVRWVDLFGDDMLTGQPLSERLKP